MLTKELVAGQHTTTKLPALSAVNRKTLGVGSLLVSLALVYLVGFAPMAPLHNAAHDTRHTAAFPCH